MGTKIVLLEARHSNPEHHRGTEFYPFLQGLWRSLGFDVEWLVVSAMGKTVLQGESYELDLEESQRQALLDEIGSFAPDRLVATDPFSPDLAGACEAASPSTRISFIGGRISYESTASDALDLIGAGWSGSADAGTGPSLVDAEHLSFERRFLDEAIEKSDPQFHRLAVRFRCSYRRKASSNRFFAHLDSPAVREFRGCTFCYLPILFPPGPVRRSVVKREVDLAVRQILSHQDDASDAVTSFQYLVDQSLVGENVHLLLEELLRREVKPSHLTAMMRPDMLLAKRDRLEDLLPRMEKGGHHLQLVSIGTDNLSGRENERFNKGIRPETVLASHDMVKDMSRRYPDTLSCMNYSWILFTPWTRPEDLRANILGAEKMGSGVLTGILGTVLQLWDGTPITELARADGLVADRFGSLGLVALSSVPPENVREIPWRFQDPRMERIHSILIRVDPMPRVVMVPPDDPLLAEIRDAREGLPDELNAQYSRMLLGVVDAVEALGADAAISEVFGHVAEHWSPDGDRGTN